MKQNKRTDNRMRAVARDSFSGFRPIGEKLGKALGTFGLALVLIELLLITVLAICFTSLFDIPGEEILRVYSVLSPKGTIVVASIALLPLVFGVLALFKKALRTRPTEPGLAIVIAATSAFGIWWVLYQGVVSSGFADSFNLLTYAKATAESGWEGFRTAEALNLQMASSYFSLYPFQAGVFWFFYAMYRLFGDNAVLALQLMNVFANEVTILCIYSIGNTLSRDRASKAVLLGLLLMCIPLHLSASLPYGNCLGMAFGSAFLLCQARLLEFYERQENDADYKKIGTYAVTSLGLLICTVVIKSTFVLFAIAALIAWAVSLLRRGGWLGVFGTVSVVLAILLSSSLADVPVKALEDRSGFEFGEGMPKTSWILMGLGRSSISGMPGWWDFDAYNIFIEARGDMPAQKSLAAEGIAEAVKGFVDNPMDGIRFFAAKLATEWADPTFEGLHYASQGIRQDGSRFDSYGLLGYGIRYHLFMSVIDAFQSFVYISSFIALCSSFHKRNADGVVLLLAALFFTGFGCYLLWEAKSIYVLPFFMLLLPLSAKGCTLISDTLRKLFRLTGTRAAGLCQ